MNQKLLQTICKSIIESDQEAALETLDKMIKDNADVITEEREFYLFLLDSIASSLNSISIDSENPLSEEEKFKEHFKMLKKLDLFQSIISDHYLGDSFYKALIKLANYNLEEVNHTILSIATDPKIKCNSKEFVKEHNKKTTHYNEIMETTMERLSNNINNFASNVNLVREVAKLGTFSRDKLIEICVQIEELNYELRDLQEEYNKITPEERLFNEVIPKLIKELEERNDLILVCKELLLSKGANEFDIDEYIITTLAKSVGFDYRYINENDIKVIFNEIIKESKTLEKLNLPKIVDELRKLDTVRLAFDFLPVMTDKELQQCEYLNVCIEKILDNNSNTKQYSEFLQTFSTYDAIYNIYPHNILKLFYFLYHDEVRTMENKINEIDSYRTKTQDKLIEVTDKIYEIVKNSKDKTIKLENWYERFVCVLLTEFYPCYDKSTIYLLQNHKLDMDYSFFNDELMTIGPASLSYCICKYGSPEVIKTFIGLPDQTLPLYAYGFLNDKNMVSICLQVYEITKAKEIFDNPNFFWLDEGEEEELTEHGEYEIEYPYNYEFEDSLTDVINTIHDKMGKSFELNKVLTQFLRHILSSPKTKFISVEALERIYDEEAYDIIRDRYEKGEIMFTSIEVDELDSIDRDNKVRLATDEEITSVWCTDYQPLTPSVDKKMALLPKKSPDNTE